MAETYSVSDHFTNKDSSVRAMYDVLLKILNRFGPVEEDPKKTSIHINRKSALVGVETRRKYLLLTIKADHKINSPRIEKFERISANRFYHKVRIAAATDFDAELKGWLQGAYQHAE